MHGRSHLHIDDCFSINFKDVFSAKPICCTNGSGVLQGEESVRGGRCQTRHTHELETTVRSTN